MSTCAAETGTSTQRLLAEIEAHLAMARVASRENELIAAARDELIQLDWAMRLVMEAHARDRGPKSAAENAVTSNAQVPPELRDGRIVDTPHPDALPDGSCELYVHLLDMLGAKDHEDAARIIAQHHVREIEAGEGARVTLSDAQCDAIVRALHQFAKDELGYEGGLPTWDEKCFIVARHHIRAALAARDAQETKR